MPGHKVYVKTNLYSHFVAYTKTIHMGLISPAIGITFFGERFGNCTNRQSMKVDCLYYCSDFLQLLRFCEYT